MGQADSLQAFKQVCLLHVCMSGHVRRMNCKRGWEEEHMEMRLGSPFTVTLSNNQQDCVHHGNFN